MSGAAQEAPQASASCVPLTLIAVPYDLGREDVGSGRGAGAYLAGGAAEALRSRGHDVRVETVSRGVPFTTELAAVFSISSAVAAAVAGAAGAGRLPMVIAGNCNVTLGARAGLLTAGAPAGLPVVWLDAHGDFNTPETTETGYIDGMPLAMLTGRTCPGIWEHLGGEPLAEELVVHLGGRDLDRAEAEALAASRIALVDAAAIHRRGVAAVVTPALEDLAKRAGASRRAPRPPAHLHVDIDVLDPAAAPGVTFPAPAGLSLDQLLAALDAVTARFTVRCLTLTSYTPERDDDGRTTLQAGIEIMSGVAGAAAPAGPQR